jgi:hypothetical protein
VWRVTDDQGKTHELPAGEATSAQEALKKLSAKLPQGRSLSSNKLDFPKTSEEAVKATQDASLTPDQRLASVDGLRSFATPAQLQALQDAARVYNGSTGLSWWSTAQQLFLGSTEASLPSIPGFEGTRVPASSSTSPQQSAAATPNTGSSIPPASDSPFLEDKNYSPKGRSLNFNFFPAWMRGKSNRQVDSEYDTSLADSMDRRKRKQDRPDLPVVLSHYIERHGEQVTLYQLYRRCVWGEDPITGARQDGDRPPGTWHASNATASKFTNRRSQLGAIEFILSSDEWRRKLADAVATGKDQIKIEEQTLEAMFGPHYREHVYGLTRQGSIKYNSTVRVEETDFTNGGIFAKFVKDGSQWRLVTLYPTVES